MVRIVAGVFVLAALGGCGSGATLMDGGTGDARDTLYLRPFAQTDVRLQVGQKYNLDVVLSEPAKRQADVDIENPHGAFVRFSSPTVAVYGGATKGSVLVTGVSPSAGMLEVVFKLRGTSKMQVWAVKVEQL